MVDGCCIGFAGFDQRNGSECTGEYRRTDAANTVVCSEYRRTDAANAVACGEHWRTDASNALVVGAAGSQ